MKVVAIVQARMGSTRLPNKVMKHIDGVPMIELLLKRLAKSQEINEIVEITGSQEGREYGFTYSDLMQRFIPTIILDAYPNKAVSGARAIEIAKRIE